MRVSAKKIASVFVLIFAVFIFASCENKLKICADDNEINFSYKINSSEGFLNFFSALSNSDESNTIFDAEIISNLFEQSGFENISAQSDGANLFVRGKLSQNAEDPFSKSGMICLTQKKLSITLNKKNLLDFYNNLPEDLQTSLDLFMSPAFTGEEMTNEEYIELISEVYGQELADEFSAATLKLTVESPSGNKNYSIKLVEILNIKNELIFSA